MANHPSNRIIIASLFLPHTVILGSPDDYDYYSSSPEISESEPVTPSNNICDQVTLKLQTDISKPPIVSHPRPAHSSTTIQTPLTPGTPSLLNPNPNLAASTPGLALSKPTPLKSIVEDMRDRQTSTGTAPPAARTPGINRGVGVTGGLSGMNASSMPGFSRATSTLNVPKQYQPKSDSDSKQLYPQETRERKTPAPNASETTRAKEDEYEDEKFYFESNPHCNGGLKNALDSTPSLDRLWVGTLGASTDGFSDTLQANVEEKLRAEGSEAVWVNDDDFEGCYDEFCHKVLWPALHYAVPDAPRTKLFYESASYKQYLAVNRLFAQKIAAIVKPGDVIWVNDYHLMLLPLLLRNLLGEMENIKIGFFLHVAFPSSEIFRCLSVRSALLRGMLGADLVGFQTANYARHFRQTCSRILSVEALPRGTQLSSSVPTATENGQEDEKRAQTPQEEELSSAKSAASIAGTTGEHGKGRFVDVGVFPMGIDVNQLKSRKNEKEVDEWVDLLHQRYKDMKLIVGRDKLDEIQGVRQKMRAFERFLEERSEWVGKVVLIQIALPSSSSSETAEPGIQDEILTTVSHINSRFSTLTYQPVVFLHTQDVSFSQYLALLTVADAFLVTSLREGMALRTHEFVVMQEGKCEEQAGREGSYTYSAAGFRSCLPINPWDIRRTSEAIWKALIMGREEASERWRDLNKAVEKQTAQTFVIGFLNRCLRSGSSPSTVSNTSGFGSLTTFNPKKKPRMVFVDWEGGLVPSSPTAPDENAAIDLLHQLVGNGVEVYILSGHPRSSFKALSSLPANVGIVAENGCFVRKAGAEEWEQTFSGPAADEEGLRKWRNACLEILNYFTERTPSSYVIENGEASVAWKFDGSDGWARRQAAEAQNHIFDSLGERYALRIIPNTDSFLVLPNNVSRGNAILPVLVQCKDSDTAAVLSRNEKMLRRIKESVSEGQVEVVFLEEEEEGEKVREVLSAFA
ncbi:glycosyltransferase family 20 protein [Moniliophthora roreri MCA 2997]|uniref:Glycosyltransferase family 20 protein n=1 Tax=Moniliophthora roreri (strain MCA 2997) TaxID=1381753 RepID=V2Y3F8_MONRO|nr:glycosyltransferase family 20 protein [Moniliophthora roreri MCA 2997]